MTDNKENEIRYLYLCDGEDACSRTGNCYLLGGSTCDSCKHTSNEEHAKNRKENRVFDAACMSIYGYPVAFELES